MNFDFYFTGISLDEEFEFLLDNNGCVLLSQLNQRKDILTWIDKIKSKNVKCKLFIDSGAFSAWTKGVSINVDDYINFINQYQEYFTVYASVDNIPGEPKASNTATQKEVDESADKTWQNFLYMRSKVNDPDKLLCTFHCGESFEHLINILEYSDEHGPIKYLGLGGMVGKSDFVLKGFLLKCFDIISKSSNPNIKVHAFGMTKYDYLNQFYFTSTDSTTWLMTASYGNIIIDTKPIYISDHGLLDNDNIINKNPAIKMEFENKLKKYGYTLDELVGDYKKRRLFNLKSLWEWANQYNPPKKIGTKIELF